MTRTLFYLLSLYLTFFPTFHTSSLQNQPLNSLSLENYTSTNFSSNTWEKLLTIPDSNLETFSTLSPRYSLQTETIYNTTANQTLTAIIHNWCHNGLSVATPKFLQKSDFGIGSILSDAVVKFQIMPTASHPIDTPLTAYLLFVSDKHHLELLESTYRELANSLYHSATLQLFSNERILFLIDGQLPTHLFVQYVEVISFVSAHLF